jgi:hypothetical protein
MRRHYVAASSDKIVKIMKSAGCMADAELIMEICDSLINYVQFEFMFSIAPIPLFGLYNERWFECLREDLDTFEIF